MKGLVFDSSFPLVFFLINLVSFQSFLGSWAADYTFTMDRQNPKSVESLQGSVLPLQKVGLKASAEMPLTELEHVGTCWCPEGS